jgi:hypothetical protein
VTRKGAIRAREGDLGIIPGSMGQRSYIVRGKGNPRVYTRAAHGAGRKMGRKEARRRFTVADLIAQTEGVECRKDDAVLDEIPGAYKDIDEVMANQADLVEVVHTLKQVMCVKGASYVSTLPSRFQLGDKVRARGTTGLISGICFRAGKIHYEVGGVMHGSEDVMEPLAVIGNDNASG